MDTEVFSLSALERAEKEAKSEDEREHVTLYLYRHPDKFRLANIKNSEDLSKYRLTVDTSEDFQLIKLILEELFPNKPSFNLQDVIQLLRQHPEWVQLNAHIQQKNIKPV